MASALVHMAIERADQVIRPMAICAECLEHYAHSFSTQRALWID
ncbi:hypothetical protein SAMN03159496_05596 [Rhizobium sp. NFR07]|nr:hypothetical protein SAMN03159496_05596 [Rhizobium sp. NFR07]